MSAMELPSSPADPSPRRGPRRAEWALSALIVVLQFVAPRTGAVEAESLPVWAGVLVLLMAVGQGLCRCLRPTTSVRRDNACPDLLCRPGSDRGRRTFVCSLGGDLGRRLSSSVRRHLGEAAYSGRRG